MSSVQKVSLSLLIAVLVFSGFAILAWSGLFDTIETTFYSTRVRESIYRSLGEAAAVVERYHNSNSERFRALLDEDSVRNAYLVNQSQVDIAARESFFGRLEEEMPALLFVRFLNNDGSQLHYSTLPSDYSQGNNRREYGQPDEVFLSGDATDLVLDDEVQPDVALSPERNAFIYRFLVVDTFNITRGTALFYVGTGGVASSMLRDGYIQVGESLRVVSPSAVVVNFPDSLGAGFEAVIAQAASAGEAGGPIRRVESDGGAGFLLFQQSTPRFGRFVYVTGEGVTEMTDVMKIVLLVSVFLTAFLIMFLLLNLKQDAVVVLSDRVKRFQINLLREYMDSKEDVDWERWQLEFEQRREQVNREIKRGIGKVKGNKGEEIDRLINRSWDEILTVIGARHVSSRSSEGVDLERLESMIERVVSNFHGLPEPRSGSGNSAIAAAAPSVGGDTEETVEDLEDFEEAEDAEEAELLDEAAEVEEIEEAEAVEEAEPVEDIDEFEEAEEVEPLDEVGEAEEVADTDQEFGVLVDVDGLGVDRDIDLETMEAAESPETGEESGNEDEDEPHYEAESTHKDSSTQRVEDFAELEELPGSQANEPAELEEFGELEEIDDSAEANAALDSRMPRRPSKEWEGDLIPLPSNDKFTLGGAYSFGRAPGEVVRQSSRRRASGEFGSGTDSAGRGEDAVSPGTGSGGTSDRLASAERDKRMETVSIEEVLSAIGGAGPVIGNDHGVAQISGEAYTHAGAEKDEDLGRLVDSVTGEGGEKGLGSGAEPSMAGESQGIDDLLGLESIQLFDDLFEEQDSDPQGDRGDRDAVPEAEAFGGVRLALTEYGLDYDLFLRRYRSNESGIIKSLVEFTRLWDARVGCILVSRDRGLTPAYYLGFDDGCMKSFVLGRRAGPFPALFEARRFVLLKRPMAEFEYFARLCPPQQLIGAERALFVPVTLKRRPGYVLLGLNRSITNLKSHVLSVFSSESKSGA